MDIHIRKIVIVFLVLMKHLTLRYDTNSNEYNITTNYASASIVNITDTNKEIYFETWGVYFRGAHYDDNFTVTSQLVMAKPSHACSSLNSTEVENKIVLIDSNNCDPQEKAKHAQNAGAIGVIIAEYHFHPPLTYLTDGRDHSDLHVPTVQISSSDFHELRKYISEYDNVMMVLRSDPNPWDKTYGNLSLWIAYVAFVISTFGTVCLFACYKLHQYRAHKEKAKAKLAILILVAVFCLECMVGWIDPIGTLGIYSYKVSTLISSIHFPFGLTIYFLLVLYWAEVTRGVAPNFTKIMRPFVCISPIFFLAEFASWIPRFMFFDTGVILFALLLMYIISFAIATIFYLKNGTQIIMTIHKNSKLLERRSEVKKLSFYILFIAGCHALDTLLFIAYVIIGIGPIFNPCLYWIHAFLTVAITLSEVLMFPDVRSAKDVELAVYNLGMNETQSSTLSDAVSGTASGSDRDFSSSANK